MRGRGRRSTAPAGSAGARMPALPARPGAMTMHGSLTQGFTHFLRRRRSRRHFERRPLLEALTAPTLPLAAAPGAVVAPGHVLGQELLASALDEPAQALARLQSHPDGLDAAEAARRLARDGPNEIQHEPAAAGLAAPVALLPQPLQPAADGPGPAVLRQRRRTVHGGDRRDGGAQHRHPLRAGGPLAPCRREACAPWWAPP